MCSFHSFLFTFKGNKDSHHSSASHINVCRTSERSSQRPVKGGSLCFRWRTKAPGHRPGGPAGREPWLRASPRCPMPLSLQVWGGPWGSPSSCVGGREGASCTLSPTGAAGTTGPPPSEAWLSARSLPQLTGSPLKPSQEGVCGSGFHARRERLALEPWPPPQQGDGPRIPGDILSHQAEEGSHPRPPQVPAAVGGSIPPSVRLPC